MSQIFAATIFSERNYHNKIWKKKLKIFIFDHLPVINVKNGPNTALQSRDLVNFTFAKTYVIVYIFCKFKENLYFDLKKEYKEAPSRNFDIIPALWRFFFVGFLKELWKWKKFTVEKLERAYLSVLNKLEKWIKLRDKFEFVNPALKSYFRCKDAIVESGIYALLKLVT